MRPTLRPSFGLFAALAVLSSGCVSDPAGIDEVAQRASVTPVPSSATLFVQDHWASSDSITVIDEPVGWPVYVAAAYQGSPFAYYPACFRPKSGILVAPGTASVTVSVEANPPPTANELKMQISYKTALGKWKKVGTLGPGGALSVDVSPEETDTPLQAASLWTFCLAAYSEPAGAWPSPSLRMRVEAKRGTTLPTFDPAGDPWRGADRAALVSSQTRNVDVAFVVPYGGPPPDWGCLSCDGHSWSGEAGVLAGYGTTRIQAALSWDWAGASKPVLLAFFGPDEVPATLVADGEAERSYEIAVEPSRIDSPYQPFSLWEFQALMETGPSDQVGAAAVGTMTLTVEATRG